MNEQKPLRQEDYLATAEELRRLTAEVERLRPPKKKEAEKAPARRWTRNLDVVFGVTTMLAVLVAMPIIFCTVVGRDQVEQAGPVTCYQIAQTRGDHPWDPYYVWEKRKGRNRWWTTRIDGKTWETEQAARQFLDIWKLEECR